MKKVIILVGLLLAMAHCQCLQKAPGLLDKCLEYYYEHYK